MAIDGKTVGLALSGGGFRATLFGLGSLWRLNDSGLLGVLDRVTSVSGGSIAAGVLAHRWPRLTFDNGTATNFVAEIATPLRDFCNRTIDIGAGLLGLITPFKTAGDFLADCYRKQLFGDTTTKDLPRADTQGNPKFIFYATNLQTGRSFRFREDMLADYMLGVSRTTVVPLATAVAASSAFPPVFSPVELETDPASWSDGRGLPNQDELRRRIVLTDGGVYDNMGLESLVDNVDIVLVSDAGAPFAVEEKPHGDYLRQLDRVRDILIDQTRALRKRWLIDEFTAGRKRGAYWGITTRIADYADTDAIARDSEASGVLDAVPTRLAAFSAKTEGRLINWGYALCDAALRRRAALAIPPASGFPVPEFPLP